MKVKAFYDQSFKSKFGPKANQVIRKVISHAQNHFHWTSLTTKIKLWLVTFVFFHSYETLQIIGIFPKQSEHVAKS